MKNITAQTVQLIDDMLDTMYAAPGVELAAPQVGALERIIVMDVDHENPHKQIYKLINPVVTRAEGEIIWEERLLSCRRFHRRRSARRKSKWLLSMKTKRSSRLIGRRAARCRLAT